MASTSGQAEVGSAAKGTRDTPRRQAGRRSRRSPPGRHEASPPRAPPPAMSRNVIAPRSKSSDQMQHASVLFAPREKRKIHVHPGNKQGTCESVGLVHLKPYDCFSVTKRCQVRKRTSRASVPSSSVGAPATGRLPSYLVSTTYCTPRHVFFQLSTKGDV